MGTARRPPSSLGGQKPLTITERERVSGPTSRTQEVTRLSKFRLRTILIKHDPCLIGVITYHAVVALSEFI